jgi:Arc/MetJ-type ribon-helix-helix transcriptional regulator
MGKTKIAITIDEPAVREIDMLVRRRVFANRSQLVQEAVCEKLVRIEHDMLAEECAELDPLEEKNLADEGMKTERDTWPEY